MEIDEGQVNQLELRSFKLYRWTFHLKNAPDWAVQKICQAIKLWSDTS